MMKPWIARVVPLLAGLLLGDAALAQASPPSSPNAYRSQRWDFTVQLRGIEGKDFDFSGGSTATTKDAVGFGFGIAYNVNRHFNIGGEFSYASANHNATIQPAPGNSNPAYTGRSTLNTTSWTDYDGAASGYPGVNIWRLELGFKN